MGRGVRHFGTTSGGTGDMMVTYWIGSKTDTKSRKIIYSVRLALKAGQEKTIHIKWEHGGLGAIGHALWYGGGDGIEFLP